MFFIVFITTEGISSSFLLKEWRFHIHKAFLNTPKIPLLESV